jgi:ArsR family transcriptional regulator
MVVEVYRGRARKLSRQSREMSERKLVVGAVPAANAAPALAGCLKALAEPNRLRIVDLLMQGEQCNCEMGDRLNMAANLMSHHLRVLSEAGLIVMRRDEFDARWIHYSMNIEALDRLNSTLTSFFDPSRIGPRRPACPPQSNFVRVEDMRHKGVTNR